MPDPYEHERTVEQSLRDARLRLTPQRRVVLSVFNGEHLSAPEVYERVQGKLPSLARATVYNALSNFVRAGLLQIIEVKGERLYDPNLDPSHHHFYCRRCGGVYDVHIEGDPSISNAEEFTVDRRTIVFTGLCPCCEEV